MHFEPFKHLAGKIVKKSPLLRKVFYFTLGVIFLRSWHFRKALKKVGQNLPPDASVLDAGSGMGQHTWWMARNFRGWKIKGIDIISEQVNDCNEFFRRSGMGNRISFEVADLVNYSEENQYDLIVSVDVIEHIENDIQVFKNFWSSLKNGGVLLITTPSDRGGSGITSAGNPSFIDEHVRNGYSTEEITDKLKSAGFSNIETTYTYGKPGHVSWLISVKYPAVLLDKSLIFAIMLPFYFVIVLPLALILNTIDLNSVHKTGTGLLIKAIKTEK